MYAPYQVWKFHPDNLKSITWWIFHLKRKKNNCDWFFYDSVDEDWNVLETTGCPITEEWELLPKEELDELWKEQLQNYAPFTKSDIAERKPRVWVFNSRIHNNPLKKVLFSNLETLKLIKVWKGTNKEPNIIDPIKPRGALFWIFHLKKKIIFGKEKKSQFEDNWLVYNFKDGQENGQWESISEKTRNEFLPNATKISYKTLFKEWNDFFYKLENRPNYINISDIAEEY